jgi:hypothetical protein
MTGGDRAGHYRNNEFNEARDYRGLLFSNRQVTLLLMLNRISRGKSVHLIASNNSPRDR